jgi:hypothetical protein
MVADLTKLKYNAVIVLSCDQSPLSTFEVFNTNWLQKSKLKLFISMNIHTLYYLTKPYPAP